MSVLSPEASTLPLSQPYPEINLEKIKDPVLIIPDVDPNYLKDPDSLDYIYIAQRYIWLALDYASKGKPVILFLPETHDTLALRNFIMQKFSKLTKNIFLIKVDPRFYLLSNSISGLLPDIPGIRQNPQQSPEDFFREVPSDNEVAQIVKSTQKSLSNALGKAPPLEIRTYYPHPKFLIPTETINTANPKIHGKEDMSKIAQLKGKKWMHPYRKNEEYPYPDIIQQVGEEYLPLGYFVPTSDGLEGIEHAILKLNCNAKKPDKFIIKPILASSGEGITFAQIIEENGKIKINFYQDPNFETPLENAKEIFQMGDIIVEEFLDLNNGNLKLNGQEIASSFVIPYSDGEVEKFKDNQILLQLTQNEHYIGGALVDITTASELFSIETSTLQKELEKLENRIQKLINSLGLQGSGAIDILVTRDGQFVISDPNLGRDTGSMPLRTVKQLFEKQPSIMVNVQLSINKGFLPSSILELFRSSSVDHEYGALPMTIAQDDEHAHMSVLLRGKNMKDINQMYTNLLDTINALQNASASNTIQEATKTTLFSIFSQSSPDKKTRVGTIPYSQGL